VAAVIGSPVRHSLSPAIHNAAFAAAGLDWVYLAFDVEVPGVAAVLAGARAAGIRGLSVTMPLKDAVAASVDELTPVAARLGAVNTVIPGGAGLIGDNTDGAGFVDALAPWSPAGHRCVVVGAGGAARAIVLALSGAGAVDIAVVARSPERAGRAIALGGRPGDPRDVDRADLVVNATPVGMDGGPAAGHLPLDEHLLTPGQLVVDLVYHPLRTPWLAAAARRGATPVDGVGMLVHQAGHAFRAWTGLAPPLAAMEAAARRALALSA
jgi:shikimate dehydrogenase